jgi:hypothetical protein
MANPNISGCKFEQVDGNPNIPTGQRLACLACRGMFDGDAVLSVDNEGFTNMESGGCSKYGIGSAPADTHITVPLDSYPG